MTKQAKIVAMTCTHAALKRREFLQLGLKYDNLLMEESAQILEIETFIPMLLQVSFLTSTVGFGFWVLGSLRYDHLGGPGRGLFLLHLGLGSNKNLDCSLLLCVVPSKSLSSSYLSHLIPSATVTTTLSS